MPLTPPPDYTKTFFAAAVGVTLALIVWLLTKNTLPISGDRDHNLPHGGWYRDGTKAVQYNRPCKLNSIEGHNRSFLAQPWALVILLVLLILLSCKLNRRVCARCGVEH
nr:TGB2 [Phlox virus M]